MTALKVVLDDGVGGHVRFRRVIREVWEKIRHHWLVSVALFILAATGAVFAYPNNFFGTLSGYRANFPSEATPSPTPQISPGTVQSSDIVQKLSEQEKQLRSSPLNTGHNSPEAIMEDIDKATPGMREETARDQLGISIDWNLLLKDIKPMPASLGEGIVVLTQSGTGLRAIGVFFSLPKDRAGELKRLPEEHPIRVKGKIKQISNGL